MANIGMTQKLAALAVVIGLLGTTTSAQNARQTTATVQGVVFTIDPKGGHPVVPGAKISLDGPAHLEAEAGAEGRFSISGITPGSYAIIS